MSWKHWADVQDTELLKQHAAKIMTVGERAGHLAGALRLAAAAVEEAFCAGRDLHARQEMHDFEQILHHCERIGATVTETPGSHAVYVSNPAVVAGLIRQAAQSALRETTAVA